MYSFTAIILSSLLVMSFFSFSKLCEEQGDVTIIRSFRQLEN